MAEIRDVVDGKPIEEAKPVEPTGKGVLDAPAADPNEHELNSFFGLETESEKTANLPKVKAILAWAKTQTEDHSPENLKWVIRDLEFKLGSPGIGEKIVDYVHQYVGLVAQREEIDSKLKKYNPYGK